LIFYRHRDHRDLPSFPTRRSSDLMRKILLGLGLSALILSTGCSGIQNTRNGGQVVSRVRTPQPNAVAMVSYLNENAQRMQGLTRSEEHTSELQSLTNLVCRLLLEK